MGAAKQITQQASKAAKATIKPLKAKIKSKLGKIPKPPKQLQAPEPTKHLNGPLREALRAQIKQLQQFLSQEGLPDIVRRILQENLKSLHGQLKNMARADFEFYHPLIEDMMSRFTDDSVSGKVTLTRGGLFEYDKGVRVAGHDKPVKAKSYAQLKGLFPRYQHLPMFGTEYSKTKQSAHAEAKETLIGYSHGPWEFDDEKQLVSGNWVFFNDDIDGDDLPVSIRFYDESSDSDLYQDITGLAHVAVSLDRSERDRCSTAGGHPCRTQLIQSPDLLAGAGMVSDFTSNDEDDARMADPKDKKDDEETSEDDEEDTSKDKKKDDMVGEKPTDKVVLTKEDFAKLMGKVDGLEKAQADFTTKLTETVAERVSQITKDANELVSLRTKLKGHWALKSDFDVEKAGLDELRLLDKTMVEKGTSTGTYRGQTGPALGTEDDFAKHEADVMTLIMSDPKKVLGAR